jgi:hypothetical protein
MGGTKLTGGPHATDCALLLHMSQNALSNISQANWKLIF